MENNELSLPSWLSYHITEISILTNSIKLIMAWFYLNSICIQYIPQVLWLSTSFVCFYFSHLSVSPFTVRSKKQGLCDYKLSISSMKHNTWQIFADQHMFIHSFIFSIYCGHIICRFQRYPPLYLFFYYSYVRTRLGSFLPPPLVSWYHPCAFPTLECTLQLGTNKKNTVKTIGNIFHY
jgi:hypothetical protein